MKLTSNAMKNEVKKNLVKKETKTLLDEIETSADHDRFVMMIH